MTLLNLRRNDFLTQTLLVITAFGFFLTDKTTFGAEERRSPQRIASLSLASDEILIELLQECGGLKRLVALSVFSDDPSSSNITLAAKSVPGRVHSEPESLLRLKPDLVIGASFNRQELLDAIRAKKIPLFTLQGFATAADIARHMREIGALIQCDKGAAKMAEVFLAIADQPPPALKIKPRLLSYSQDLTIMAADTLFDDLVRRSGATNAATSLKLKMWPRVDSETLLSLNPDALVVLGPDTPAKRQEIKNHAAWGRLRAVREQKIIFLTARTALSTSRFFAEALIELRSQLSQSYE